MNGTSQQKELPSARFSRILEWCAWERNTSLMSLSTENGLIYYGRYYLSRKQFFLAALLAYTIIFAAIYLFYHSIIISFIAAASGVIAPRFYRKMLLVRRKERVKLQFKDALFSLTSSLAAGWSIENAFISTLDDLKLLYPDPRTELLKEFQIVRIRLGNARAARDYIAKLG